MARLASASASPRGELSTSHLPPFSSLYPTEDCLVPGSVFNWGGGGGMVKCPKSLPHQASGMRAKGATEETAGSQGLGYVALGTENEVLLTLSLEEWSEK